MLPPIDYSDGKIRRWPKNAVNKYLHLMLCYMVGVIGVYVFVMFYYSSKINHSLVQLLLYLLVVYRASFVFCENEW